MRPRGCLAILAAGAHSLSIRRLILFLMGILLLSTTLLLFTPKVLPESSSYANLRVEIPESVSNLKNKIHVPIVPNLFAPAVHAPPEPVANSTKSTESWFGSYKWLNPFSSTIGNDDRIALPPQQDRCKVYTYYERPTDALQAGIDDKMLLAWRRAWWALGFKPLILGEGEAKQHGLYEKVYRDKLSPELQAELMRWLAWSRVGSGILTNFRVLPMGPHDDVTIVALRRCEFVYASKYKNFGQKLYSGDILSIDKILQYVTSRSPEKLEEVKTIEQAIYPNELLTEDDYPASMADYSPEVILEKYRDLNPTDLPHLVNAHLHSTFLSHYIDGISVMQPFIDDLKPVYHNALVLAHQIASCPVRNPLPESCPPNLPQCSPCKKAATVSSPQSYIDSTKTFLIGTVPHPLTTIELRNKEVNLLKDPESISIRWVRRNSQRDIWLHQTTSTLLRGIGNHARLLALKETIGTKPGLKFTSLWSTDKTGFKDVEWTLGFTIPPIEKLNLPGLPEADSTQDQTYLDVRKAVRKGKGKLLNVIEGWNLGDTEVWKFVNAWEGRKEAVRKKWSKEEKSFGLGVDESEK